MSTTSCERGTDLHDYTARLTAFNWAFQRSRDRGGYVFHCKRELRALQELQRRIDPDATVWNTVVPEAWRLNP